MAMFKIMTFNIATCREPEGGIIDVARIIEGEQADIIAMQEVDKCTYRSGASTDQLSLLAHHANYSHKLFISSMDFQGGHMEMAFYQDTISTPLSSPVLTDKIKVNHDL